MTPDAEIIRTGTVPIRSGQTGIAGEHFVTGELLRRGWLAAMVKGNSPLIDILASKGTRTIQVQVKTRSSGSKADSSLAQAKLAGHVYYIVVDFHKGGADYYIIPGIDLERFYYRSPCGILGRIPFRRIAPFKERWDLLEADRPLLIDEPQLVSPAPDNTLSSADGDPS